MPVGIRLADGEISTSKRDILYGNKWYLPLILLRNSYIRWAKFKGCSIISKFFSWQNLTLFSTVSLHSK